MLSSIISFACDPRAVSYTHLIEMSACRGSCVGGPVMEKYHCSPVSNYNQVASYAKSEDFDVAPVSPEEIYREHDFIGTSRAMPTQSEIEAILKKIGKLKPEDELNCGSCGYNTCREKAIAVYQGKADLNMCLDVYKRQKQPAPPMHPPTQAIPSIKLPTGSFLEALSSATLHSSMPSQATGLNSKSVSPCSCLLYTSLPQRL